MTLDQLVPLYLLLGGATAIVVAAWLANANYARKYLTSTEEIGVIVLTVLFWPPFAVFVLYKLSRAGFTGLRKLWRLL